MKSSTSYSTDVLVIGAGIIGLAITYQLQQLFPHLKITVLEKEQSCGAHQSGRNSGVVHSGVYYKPGSLKAQNCIEGRSALLNFCKENEVPLAKMGKVIVATREEEIPYLLELQRRGQENGVKSLQIVDKEQLRDIEPHAFGIKALWVPECYSINFRDVVNKLLLHTQKIGANLVLGQEVVGISSKGNEVVVETTSTTYKASFLVNCAGLQSDRIASLILKKDQVPFQIVPFRGEYWELKPEKRNLVQGLIYPVPNPQFPFLGVHLSRMIDGKVLAGPNAVLALAREGYRKSKINVRDCLQYACYPGFWKMALRYWDVGAKEIYRSLSKKAFVKDVQRLLPEAKEEDFIKGKSGVRAQVLKKDGTMLDDFAIFQTSNTLHVLNAPSPAATSCLSIAKSICKMIEGSLK